MLKTLLTLQHFYISIIFPKYYSHYIHHEAKSKIILQQNSPPISILNLSKIMRGGQSYTRRAIWIQKICIEVFILQNLSLML